MGAVLAWCGWQREEQAPPDKPLFVTHPPVASKPRDSSCDSWVTIFKL